MDRGDREEKEEEGGKWCEYDYEVWWWKTYSETLLFLFR